VAVAEAEQEPAAEVEAGGWVQYDVADGKMDGSGVQTERETELGNQVAPVNTKAGRGVGAGTESGVGLVAEAVSMVPAECAEFVAPAFDSDCMLLLAAVAVAQVSGESSDLGVEPMAVFVVVAETAVEGIVLYKEGSQGFPAGALVEAGPVSIAVVVSELVLWAEPSSAGRFGEEDASAVDKPGSVALVLGPTAVVEADFGDILWGKEEAVLGIVKEGEEALGNVSASEMML